MVAHECQPIERIPLSRWRFDCVEMVAAHEFVDQLHLEISNLVASHLELCSNLFQSCREVGASIGKSTEDPFLFRLGAAEHVLSLREAGPVFYLVGKFCQYRGGHCVLHTI